MTGIMEIYVISLKIRQATKKGYIEVYPKGVFDCSYPTSKSRRGRVIQGGAIIPAITCKCENVFLVYEGTETDTGTQSRNG